jgi:salicylate 5-hydroxylase large subunit
MTSTVFPQTVQWEDEGTSRIPFMAHTDESTYKKELERFFYRNHWCYVGLEAEIPNPGDFTRTTIGKRSVIMVRGADGNVNVIENACAHRGR